MNIPPKWDELYALAESQGGYFLGWQTVELGFIPQELSEAHRRGGQLQRIQRGVYRLAHFLAGENEDLAVLWMWSQMAGIFSHETALALHEGKKELFLPIHLTVPSWWAKRRLTIPTTVLLHYSDVPPDDQTKIGYLPVTTMPRALADCRAHLAYTTFKSARSRVMKQAKKPKKKGIVKLFFQGKGST